MKNNYIVLNQTLHGFIKAIYSIFIFQNLDIFILIFCKEADISITDQLVNTARQEKIFNDLARIAAAAFCTPIGAITIQMVDRSFLIGRHGLMVPEMSADHNLGAFADAPLLFEDLQRETEPRLAPLAVRRQAAAVLRIRADLQRTVPAHRPCFRCRPPPKVPGQISHFNFTGYFRYCR